MTTLMKYYLLHLLFVLPFISLAQDSLLQTTKIYDELTNKSMKSLQSKYFTYIPIRMQEGDRILIAYSSKDYIPELIVQDSVNNLTKKDADDRLAQGKESTVLFPYMTPNLMVYYFGFSTKEEDKTGKFSVKIFYYNHHLDTFKINTPFCSKLKYIVENSRSNFEFLKKRKIQSDSIQNFSPSVELIQGKNNVIQNDSIIGTYYVTVCGNASNKKDADREFNDVTKLLDDCLTGYKKNIEKNEWGYNLRYIIPGNDFYDINANHKKYNEKAEVSLERGLSEGLYYVEIIVH